MSQDINIGQITEALNDKLDRDGMNAGNPASVIVESYVNGTSWYRVYSDGWCEQGGNLTNNLTSAGNLTVTFLKPFINTNYSFLREPIWSSGSIVGATSDAYSVGYNSKTQNSITFITHDNSFVLSINWQACGYIS